MARYKKYEDKFKSTLERSLSKSCLKDYDYEPKEPKLSYSVPHIYNPDFVHPNNLNIIVEVKGYFIKGSSDCQKYLAIIKDNPDKELIFLFSNPDKRAYPQCRARADGSFLTLAEWCKRNNILYFTQETMPKDLQRGRWTVEDARKFKQEVYSN